MKPGNEHTVDAFAVIVSGGVEQFFVRRLVPVRPATVVRLLRIHYYSVVEQTGFAVDTSLSSVMLLKPTPETHGTTADPAQIGMDTLFNEINTPQSHRSRSNVIDAFRTHKRFEIASGVGFAQLESEEHFSQEYDLLIPGLWAHFGYDYTVTINATEVFVRVEFRLEKATPKELATVNYNWGQDPRDQGLENL